MSQHRAYILGVGLVSPLGADFTAACAAYTAGARHFRRVPSLCGIDGLPMTIGEVLPYEAVRDYPERLRRLTTLALEDLAAAGPLPATSTFLATLDAWVADSPMRAALAQPTQGISSRGEISYGGPAEALLALGKAASLVRNGEAETVVVAALSSALHAGILDRRALEGRVLSKANPYAGFPSEAACFFLIGRHSAGARPLGEILGFVQAQEAEDLAAPKGVRGRALADLCAKVVAHMPPQRLLIDLTGERWRADELAYAASAAGPTVAALCSDLELPALYLGDCDCALGLALPALAFAPRPARKGEAPAADVPAHVLTLASSRPGKRAALMLRVLGAAER